MPPEEKPSGIVAALREAGAEADEAGDVITFRFGDARGQVTAKWRLGLTSPRTARCSIPVPADAPILELDVRPETPDRKLEFLMGGAIDLQLDDAPFDEAFLVEAAPSEAAHLLLDDSIRAPLLALAPCRLWRDGDTMHLEKAADALPSRVVLDMVRLAVAVHERLSKVAAELALRRQSEASVNQVQSYREAPAAPKADPNSARDLAELAQARATRRRLRLMRLSWVGTMLLMGLVMFAVERCR